MGKMFQGGEMLVEIIFNESFLLCILVNYCVNILTIRGEDLWT